MVKNNIILIHNYLKNSTGKFISLEEQTSSVMGESNTMKDVTNHQQNNIDEFNQLIPPVLNIKSTTALEDFDISDISSRTFSSIHNNSINYNNKNYNTDNNNSNTTNIINDLWIVQGNKEKFLSLLPVNGFRDVAEKELNFLSEDDLEFFKSFNEVLHGLFGYRKNAEKIFLSNKHSLSKENVTFLVDLTFTLFSTNLYPSGTSEFHIWSNNILHDILQDEFYTPQNILTRKGLLNLNKNDYNNLYEKFNYDSTSGATTKDSSSYRSKSYLNNNDNSYNNIINNNNNNNNNIRTTTHDFHNNNSNVNIVTTNKSSKTAKELFWIDERNLYNLFKLFTNFNLKVLNDDDVFYQTFNAFLVKYFGEKCIKKSKVDDYPIRLENKLAVNMEAISFLIELINSIIKLELYPSCTIKMKKWLKDLTDDIDILQVGFSKMPSTKFDETITFFEP